MENKNKTDHRYLEKKRLELDMAYCDVTYNSKEGLDRCYTEAKEASHKRENTGKHT